MKTRILTLLGIVLPLLSGLQAAVGDSLKPKDTLVTLPFQFTFISPIGTNGLMSAKTTHYFSVNTIAGYNGGVDGLEIGGFANILEYDMRGSQLAGFANVVRGDVQGFQAAGFSNYVHGNSSGLMLAGFTNHCNKSSMTVKAAGFSNQVLGSEKGVELAGFANICLDSLKGGQAAGFTNYAGDDSKGTQIAGFANTVKGNLDGAQIAGFSNAGIGDLKGAQIAGFGNVCRDLEGVQVSGFLNLAKNVKGTQVGFINICDSVEQGMPVGFLSFVRKGYRSYSFAANEVGWAEFQFRTGTDKLHNIFAAGISPIPGIESWSFGYGLGSKILDTERSDIFLDLMAYQVNEGEIWNNAYNALYRFSARYAYSPKGNKFNIWGAPSLNLHHSSYQSGDGTAFASKLSPYAILEDKGTYVHSKVWIGAQVGLSF